ncbi:ABC-2 transporter permease [Peptococcaceae bacterium 1198_IL3148]
MYSLVIKDILVQKRTVLISLLYIIFLAFMLQSLKEGIYPVTISGICYILVATACAQDEKNKADVMLNSLPIKRSTIVGAKYVLAIVIFAIGTVAYLAIMQAMKFIGLPLQVYPITLANCLGTLLAISLLNGIYLPIYFKLGYIKSRFINLILFFSLFAGISSIATLLGDSDGLPNLISFVNSYSELQIAIMIVMLTLAILALSYTVSLKVYNSREF